MVKIFFKPRSRGVTDYQITRLPDYQILNDYGATPDAQRNPMSLCQLTALYPSR